MKKLEGKKTFSWLAFLTVTQFPELSNPVWEVLADTGLGVETVSIIKIVSFILGAAGVIYGRMKAKGKAQ